MASGDPLDDLRAGDRERRRAAARRIVDPARCGWDRLADAGDRLTEAVEDPDPVVRGHALVAFFYAVVDPPATGRTPGEGMERVLAALTDPAEPVRRTALGLLVTSEFREALDGDLEARLSAGLFECLTADSPALERRAARLLTASDVLAHPDPGAVVGWLVDRLAGDGPATPATDHLPAVARTRPAAVAPHADRLGSLLSGGDAGTRELAARTLAATAGTASFDHERVRATLTADLDPGEYRENPGVVSAVADLARTDRALAERHVAAILPGLFGSERTRRSVGAALAAAVRPHPDLTPGLEPLVEHHDEGSGTLGADPLEVLGRASPKTAVDLLERVVAEEGPGELSRGVFGTLAEANPGVVPGLLPTVRTLLARDRDGGSTEGVRAARNLARAAPGELDGLRPDLLEYLDDPGRGRAEWALESLFRSLAAGGGGPDPLDGRRGTVERHLAAVDAHRRYFAAVTLASVADPDDEPGLGARIRRALPRTGEFRGLPVPAALDRYLDRHYPERRADPDRLCWGRGLPGPGHPLFDRRFPLGVVAECRPALAERAVAAAADAVPDASGPTLRRDVGTALSRVATADPGLVAAATSALAGVATDDDADDRRRAEAVRGLALVALGDPGVVARAVDPGELPALSGTRERLRGALDGEASFRDLAVGMPGPG